MPNTVFETLYESTCRNIALRFALPSSWYDTLLSTYRALDTALTTSATSAIAMHRSKVASLVVDWGELQSSKLCLWCLIRQPEHPLYCGHSLCDTCAKAFGEPLAAEYSFLVARCILCEREEDLIVRLKPPTAGTRLLVLDGGGIRGAFTLLALKTLEEKIRLPHPLREEFDLVVGTSSGMGQHGLFLSLLTCTGGLIALMILLGRSLMTSISLFDEMVQRVFWQDCRKSRFCRMFSCLRSLFTDSIYGAKAIETCVKEAFGTDVALFGKRVSSQKVSSLKCAVTTMTVFDSKLCLLTNYNGPSQREGL